MSLYDQVKQAQSPYMSQFVGSIAPEANAYSATMQKRYDDAANSDDALGEALGNLQHLQLDEDTQYANELKNEYYQRLQERASSGDFENMGRRTRQDAIRFSQAYMPLVQRQKDLAEVVKKVNADPSIADPQKKAQILQYIQHLNTTPKSANGDYTRDAAGRIQLNGIQDWAYAKDVDINKKLADLLSKKETDIRQSGYSSDGQGLKISSIQELRSPQVMARLAKEMMQTDPEIKAMLTRDVTLQNYGYTDEEIADNLKGADLTPYQVLKKRGLSERDIAVIAKSNGLDKKGLNTSVISSKKAQLMQQGLSETAANRAILNDQTMQRMIEPHADFIGGLLAVDKRKLDAREDGLFLLRAKQSMDDAEKGFIQIIDRASEVETSVNAREVASSYVKSQAALKSSEVNVNAAVLEGLKRAGIATGDPKRDIELAHEYALNRGKMNQLKSKLLGSNPDLAGRLETLQSGYLSAKDTNENLAVRTQAIEQSAGLDMDKLYKQYLSGTIPIHGAAKDSKPVTKEEFIEAVRNPESDKRGFFANLDVFAKSGLRGAIKYYEKQTAEGAKAFSGGADRRVDPYSTIEPASSGPIKSNTDLLEYQAKEGVIKLKDVANPGGEELTLSDAFGWNKAKLADGTSEDYKNKAGTSVRLNTQSIGGKPTITVRSPEGVARVYQIANQAGANIADEILVRAIKQELGHGVSTAAKSKIQSMLVGLAERGLNMTAHDINYLPPTSSKYPLNEVYSVKVKAGGPAGKTYEVYERVNGQPVGKYTTADDLLAAIGRDEYQRLSAPRR